jgi:hypothetical protein
MVERHACDIGVECRARHGHEHPRNAHHTHRLQRHRRTKRDKDQRLPPAGAWAHKAAKAPEQHEESDLDQGHGERSEEDAATKAC